MILNINISYYHNLIACKHGDKSSRLIIDNLTLVCFPIFLIGVHLAVFSDLPSEIHCAQDSNLEGPWSSIQRTAIVQQSRLLYRLDRFSNRYGRKTALKITAMELITALLNWGIIWEVLDLKNNDSDDFCWSAFWKLKLLLSLLLSVFRIRYLVHEHLEFAVHGSLV